MCWALVGCGTPVQGKVGPTCGRDSSENLGKVGDGVEDLCEGDNDVSCFLGISVHFILYLLG